MDFEKLYHALTREPADAPFHFRAHHAEATPGELPRSAAVCRLTHDARNFYASALMRAKHPRNRATADNQQTWRLGDAFEFFIQLPGHADYHEFHSTPKGIRLQLHLPDYLTFQECSHESKCCDAGLKVENRPLPEEGLWYSRMTIPFAGIGAEGPRCRFFFARYNYSDVPGDAPELSSWPFLAGTFHNPPRWPEYLPKNDLWIIQEKP